jgi:hypothetical protein
MNLLTISLFGSSEPTTIGVGYHNIGSGCHRASHTDVISRIEGHYRQRCGHLPLEAERVYVLVTDPSTEIESQWAYLSQLIGKPITPLCPQELALALRNDSPSRALVVPYINVPETEHWIQEILGATSWGLAGIMVQRLKNKADFYQFVEELQLGGMAVPEYTITHLATVPQVALRFLSEMETMISEAGVRDYPMGVMLRGAESDGHYGSCLVYEQQQGILIVPDGDVQRARSASTWLHAFSIAQQHLEACMNQQRESRVLISRFIDVAASPGLSVVILNGQVESLGWNSQLQAPGSTACVGTSPFQPANAMQADLQQATEAQTTVYFEIILRQTAQRCGLDFASVCGVANLDLMLPGPWEQQLQRSRGCSPVLYVAECNPRWTNYTDALMTILAVKRQSPTISALRSVIRAGLATIDRYPLSPDIEPERIRAELLKRDAAFRQAGMSIICRMARNPMGFIFAGDVKKAELEVARLLAQLATTTRS